MIKRFLGAGILAFALLANATNVVAQTTPALAACIAAPTTTGCSSVLPTLQACIAKPATAGCSVVLPTLAQCAKTPSLAGCVAVIAPPPSASPLPQGHDYAYAMASGDTKNVMPGNSVAIPTPSPAPSVFALQGAGQPHPTLNCVPGPTPASCASSSTVLPQGAPATTSTRGPVFSGIPAPAGTGPAGSALLSNLYTSANNVAMPSPGPTGPLTIAICSSLPSAQTGCAAILPAVAACTANGGLAGCPAVLARAKCAATTTPVPAGCPFKGIP